MEEKELVIKFYKTLYNEIYFNTIIDKWIKDTCYRFSNIEDFLIYWFDAWLKHAPLDLALNWNHETYGCISFFDIQHKKPNKNKKSIEEMILFEEKNTILKDLQSTFSIPYTFIQSNVELHKDLATSFAILIKNELFTQNKMQGKHIYLYKFKYNYLCDIKKIISLVLKRLKTVFIQKRPKQEHILFDEFVYKYTNGNPYFNGLFTSNESV